MTDPNGAAIYMVTWIPSIYPSHVSIYTSTMDPMGFDTFVQQNSASLVWFVKISIGISSLLWISPPRTGLTCGPEMEKATSSSWLSNVTQPHSGTL